MSLKYVPLRLAPDLLDRLDSIATKRAIPRAAVMREGLHFFVQRHAIMSEAEYRRVLADEFVFLALDTIIQRRHADVHTELLNEAAKRARALRG